MPHENPQCVDTLSLGDTTEIAKKAPKLLRSSQPDHPRFLSYDNKRIHLLPQLKRLDVITREGMLNAAQIFPVKINSYVADQLVDWNAAPDDPIYRLLFPHPDMLSQWAKDEVNAIREGNFSKEETNDRLRNIRDQMNPHPAGQSSNVPKLGKKHVDGVQHKYRETTLYFPKESQTCHSYCSFCFRWPQFVETSAPKFEANDLGVLKSYLQKTLSITDLLLTGGDPMVMNSRRLGNLCDVLLHPDLKHVSTVRLGTKSLSYWPYRFLTDPDSEQFLDHLKRLTQAGKHVAIMVHINHYREMQTDAFRKSVAALLATGATLRSQAPVIRHVNDDAEVWSKMWMLQTNLGIQPYYMFVERDTGAVDYFSIPLVKAHEIYKAAVSTVSGLARTARGPVMSTDPGKIQILGPVQVNGKRALALTMLQARNPDLVNVPFLAKYSETATWIDQLEPFDQASPFPF